jgi:Ca2+-binding RTX toxin-like protein
MEAYDLVGGGNCGHVGAGERGRVGRVQIRERRRRDPLRYAQGRHHLRLQWGRQRIYGFEGNDLLRGNLGNDAIYAGFGNDRIYGGLGSERIHVGNDEAVGYVYCEPGYDRLYPDDKDRYTTDCEMITPVDHHPRSERAGAG